MRSTRSVRSLSSVFASSLPSPPLSSTPRPRPSIGSSSPTSVLSSRPPPFPFCPRRSFAKRLVTDGFAQSSERRAKKKPGQAGSAAGRGGADGAAGGGLSSADGSAAAGAGGDSIAAIEAENEERLRKSLIPVVAEVERRERQVREGATLEGPYARDDGRSEEERVRDVLYVRRTSLRLSQRSRRWTFALTNKLRRRWEAMNGLTEELWHFCLREDRNSLPAHLPRPVDCYGEEVLYGTGLEGAEQPMSQKDIRAAIEAQQRPV